MPDRFPPVFPPKPKQGLVRPKWQFHLTRLLLRAIGWQLRGQLPPQFWRTTLVLWAPKRWQALLIQWVMPVRIRFLEKPILDLQGRSEESRSNFENGFTNASLTSGSREDLAAIQMAAAQAKSRIALCAWESKRRFIHIHAPFKTSPFPDRDVHYMERYFKYFRSVPY